MSQSLLLCTDLDRTLLPNGEQPESPAARNYFTQLVERPEVTLAYVSGRHRELVEAAIIDYQLPTPDWVIGDVGTTLYEVSDTYWHCDSTWSNFIARDWQGLTAYDLQHILSKVINLELQEANKQNRYKLSYYLPIEQDFQILREQILRCLRVQKIAVNLIYSLDELTQVALLDILPPQASKLHAIEFLMRKRGFTYHNTVFAGDSGNDLPVLASLIPSILVANSHPNVVAEAQSLCIANQTEGALYMAQGEFMGMNGNYSAGILEGVVHYFPHTHAWLE